MADARPEAFVPDLYHLMQLRMDPTSIWRCPCGYTGPYKRVVSHRKGWRKRPACAGRIEPVDPPPEAPADEAAAPAPVGGLSPGAEPEGGPGASGASAWEYLGPDLADLPEDGDPEEIARLINLRRGSLPAADGAGDGAPPSAGSGAGGWPPLDHLRVVDSDGGGGGDGETLPPGDWRVVPPG